MSEVLQAQYGISVNEALSLNVMKKLKLVGGKNGVNRIIKFINVIEVPDISEWIMDGEFLLTTGYSFREHPEKMRELIPELAKRGGAGLAMKPRRFIREIPEDIKRDADRYEVPLLEIPFDLSFAEIISPILEVISNKQNVLLKQLEFAHKELIELVLQGSSLQEICNRTTKIINAPVVITSDYYDEFIVAENVNEKDRHFIKKLLLNSTSDALKLQHKKMKFGNIKEIEYAFVLEGGTSDVPLNRALRIPIIVNQKSYGYIYSIYRSNFIDEYDILVLERAATVAGLEFMKRKAVFEIEKNYRNEFLDLLLSGECKEYDRSDIVQRGYSNYHIDLEKPVAVALINFGNKDKNNGKYKFNALGDQEEHEKIIARINQEKGYNQGNIFAGLKGNFIVVLLQVEQEQNFSDAKRKLAKELKERLQNLLWDSKKFKDSLVDVGVGNYYHNLNEIKYSYNEAHKTMNICQLTSGSSLLHFEDLGFYRILYEKSRHELIEFADDFLKPVLEYDQKSNGELLKTLTKYFDMNRNLKKTSQVLYTHYNTVLYRIEKIEKITGVKINHPENSLNLEIAVNIYKLLDDE